MDKLSEILAAVTQETRVHFEMASFTEHDCLRDIIDTVVRWAFIAVRGFSFRNISRPLI